MIAAIEEANSRHQRSEEDGIEIWEENWDIVTAFLSVASQWRVTATAAGSVIYTGLDYAGVRMGLAAARIRVTPDLWRGLQVMEAEYRTAVNARE